MWLSYAIQKRLTIPSPTQTSAASWEKDDTYYVERILTASGQWRSFKQYQFNAAVRVDVSQRPHLKNPQRKWRPKASPGFGGWWAPSSTHYTLLFSWRGHRLLMGVPDHHCWWPWLTTANSKRNSRMKWQR